MINGITFDLRNVKARDDARLRERILDDGILNGCALTYSGKNLTIGIGNFVLKGRQIEVSAPETIPSDTTEPNGYGRLRFVIDLSNEASETLFNQFRWEWDYQAANSGWPSLTQEDINDGINEIYEAAICIVAFSSSNISGVVSKLPALAEKYDQPIRQTNVSILTTAWASDATYEDFPFRAAVPVTGATAYHVPDIIPSPADIMTGNLAPFAETYAGGVYLYAKEEPEATVIIATLTLWPEVTE
jgi:hypothetical protein